MSMDEEETLQWIHQYQLTKEERFRDKIIERLSPLFLNYPRYVFHIKDRDTLSDFYTLVLEQIDTILLSYKKELSKFSTYLNTVLKNLWLNLRREKWQKVEGSHFSKKEDSLIAPSYLREEETHYSVEKIFSEIDETKKYLILKLYYFDFFEEKDLLLLKRYTKRSYGECLAHLNEIMGELEKKRRRQSSFERRIANLHWTILKIHQKLTHPLDPLDREKWHEEEKKLKRIQEEYLETYYSVVVFPSFKTIGATLGCTSVEVSNSIHNFKGRMKKEKHEILGLF